jgi:hypothetical protein
LRALSPSARDEVTVELGGFQAVHSDSLFLGLGLLQLRRLPRVELQGDVIGLDPRAPNRTGDQPGSITQMFKVRTSYAETTRR